MVAPRLGVTLSAPEEAALDRRITSHPVLKPPPRAALTLTWRGEPVPALEGETIAAALAASGVRVLGHHPRDGAPQGLFCANGRCAQCLVIADGRPVKACVTQVSPGLRVEPADHLPALPAVLPAAPAPATHPPQEIEVEALIVGGGPAGMAAALELSRHGADALLVDDKPHLGGKLLLQTHRFFGSANAVHAGTRGIDIAARLEREVRAAPGVRVWTGSTAAAVFSDQRVGVVRAGEDGREGYVLVKPRALLVMTGARERFVTFRGNTLPGVMGAGAFQTLVNHDLVRAAERVVILGGGNVGLIAGYHALQAGISVEALVEALPECPGYRVHRDKLARQGVPILTGHTIVSANGGESVESVTIAAADARFHPIPGTERTLPCDTLLVAVGLEPENDLYRRAVELGIPAFVAGDAEEVAEASSAIFTGRIRGLEAARALGRAAEEVPPSWRRAAEILKSRPGAPGPHREDEAPEEGVTPVFHCAQEIPCDPCSTACPQGGIRVDPDDIRHLPVFLVEALGKECVGCEKCVTICPGQAITLVDYRKDPEHPFVTLAHELGREALHPGARVPVLDVDGVLLGEAEVILVHAGKVHDRTAAVKLRVPRAIARRVAGIRTGEESVAGPTDHWVERLTDDAIVCRCERVRADELRALIRRGYRDLNELKAVTRAGMGACGARTCGSLLRRLFVEEGVPEAELTAVPRRPLAVEIPLGVLAGAETAAGTEAGHG